MLHLVADDGIVQAGYLTFLGLVALFPFLVLLGAAAGAIGESELGNRFIELLMHHLPREAVDSLNPRIDEMRTGPSPGLLTFSIVSALWTASSAVDGVRTALNRAHEVATPPTYLWRRMISILQVLLLAAVIMLVMGVLLLAPFVIELFSHSTGLPPRPEVQSFFRHDFIYIGGVLLFLAVASIYYWVPNAQHRVRAVMPGALLVVVLWVAGAWGVSFYFNHITNMNLIYGSLSSFITTLIFLFVMNLIFIYGAEFNHELMRLRDHGPVARKPKTRRRAKKA